jgi:hypothetical protein
MNIIDDKFAVQHTVTTSTPTASNYANTPTPLEAEADNYYHVFVPKPKFNTVNVDCAWHTTDNDKPIVIPMNGFAFDVEVEYIFDNDARQAVGAYLGICKVIATVRNRPLSIHTNNETALDWLTSKTDFISNEFDLRTLRRLREARSKYLMKDNKGIEIKLVESSDN